MSLNSRTPSAPSLRQRRTLVLAPPRILLRTIPGVLCLSTVSWAADPPATQETTPPPAIAPANPSPGQGATASAEAAPPVWKTSLTHYELGDYETALSLLREEVLRCGDASEGKCSQEEIGTLYACVGIVLAGGQANHNGGVQSFKKALSLNPEIALLPVYQTPPVVAAFREAKGETPQVENGQHPGAGTANSGNADAPPEDYPPYEAPPEKKRMALIFGGVLQYGVFQVRSGFGTLETEAARLGGSATAVFMPGETSGFSLGGRARGGAYIADGSLGSLGLSGVIGSTVGPRVNNVFIPILGGLGFEYFPADDVLAPTVSFQSGISLKGLYLGVNVDATIHDRVNVLMLGLELGYGQLL